ncbi:MAG TPA: GSU2403 family nucleotidyltransferase fold protein [Myxococcaceae bacterium]|jgi:hypothetical protein
MTAVSDREAFARVITALEPYLDVLVFVGGWAHRLYQFHELSNPIDFEPLATDDADLAAPLRLEVRAKPIAQHLRAAGFTEELRGDDTPPMSRYHLGEEGAGLYVEFLAPLLGAPRTRTGASRDTAVVGGVTAQTLRYVDLLLEEPWTIQLSEQLGFPVGVASVQIRIPNPASFIAQKLLVLGRRTPEKRPKDLLYVHDTLMLFSGKIASLQASWRLVSARQHSNVTKDLQSQIEARFDTVDDLIRAACRIAVESGRPSPPTPERFAAVCRMAARTVFARSG